NPGGGQGIPPPNGTILEDNSNTQFAVLGLWVARRYGVPVDKALEITEARFRRCQGADGGWAYMLDGPGTPSMTCAGLLALAVGRGKHSEDQRIMRSGGTREDNPAGKAGKDNKPSAPPAFRPKDDAGIMKALNFVGNAITQDKIGGIPGMPPGVRPPNVPQAAQFMNMVAIHNDFYCLWSIERVGMIFGESKFGDVDWYAWGSSHLVKSQNRQDGSWSGKYGPDIDTSFGLMFLCRANLVKDLSELMGNRVMRASGIKKPAPAGTAAEAPKVGNPSAPAPAVV